MLLISLNTGPLSVSGIILSLSLTRIEIISATMTDIETAASSPAPPLRETVMKLFLAAQVLPLVGQMVTEAIASVLHAQGADVPSALEAIISAISSLLAAMSVAIILGDRAMSRPRSLAPAIILEVASPTQEMDSDPDTWNQWRQVQTYQSVSSVSSNTETVGSEDACSDLV